MKRFDARYVANSSARWQAGRWPDASNPEIGAMVIQGGTENAPTWWCISRGKRQQSAKSRRDELGVLERREWELAGSLPPRSKAREEIGAGLRTLHVAKLGRRGKHFILYRETRDAMTALRILHDSMELSRHLPKDGS